MNAEQTTGQVEAVASRRGRAPRAETMATERRRRKGGINDKLAIPQSVLKNHPDMEFRWAKDEGGRIYQLTQNDDWDKVPGVEPIHGGKGEAGTGMKMHLLMKPKEFMAQDRAEKDEALKAMEQAQIAKHPETAASAIASGQDIYAVPGNKI